MISKERKRWILNIIISISLAEFLYWNNVTTKGETIVIFFMWYSYLEIYDLIKNNIK